MFCSFLSISSDLPLLHLFSCDTSCKHCFFRHIFVMQIKASKYWAYIFENIQDIIFSNAINLFFFSSIFSLSSPSISFLYQFVRQFFHLTFIDFRCSYTHPKLFCILQIISSFVYVNFKIIIILIIVNVSC